MRPLKSPEEQAGILHGKEALRNEDQKNDVQGEGGDEAQDNKNRMLERPGKCPSISAKECGERALAEAIEAPVHVRTRRLQQIHTHHRCHGERDDH